jgi:phytanoyl-CoA hydroxylase
LQRAVVVPAIGLHDGSSIDPSAVAHDYLRDGLVVVRGLLSPSELASVRAAGDAMLDAASTATHDPDYLQRDDVPYRVEYVVDKDPSIAALAAHPRLLELVEAILGTDFVPTWDSMVFKAEGVGAPIPWHRDVASTGAGFGSGRVFNIGVYLDDADLTTCLWAIPGSQSWDDDRATAALHRPADDAEGFRAAGGIPIPVGAGDVIVHDVFAVHGSPPTAGALRRVVYFEYRPIELELRIGPHVPEYVAVKQQGLVACLRRRVGLGIDSPGDAYRYRPAAPYDEFDRAEPATLRYPHERWWRRPDSS